MNLIVAQAYLFFN